MPVRSNEVVITVYEAPQIVSYNLDVEPTMPRVESYVKTTHTITMAAPVPEDTELEIELHVVNLNTGEESVPIGSLPILPAGQDTLVDELTWMPTKPGTYQLYGRARVSGSETWVESNRVEVTVLPKAEIIRNELRADKTEVYVGETVTFTNTIELAEAPTETVYVDIEVYYCKVGPGGECPLTKYTDMRISFTPGETISSVNFAWTPTEPGEYHWWTYAYGPGETVGTASAPFGVTVAGVPVEMPTWVTEALKIGGIALGSALGTFLLMKALKK